MPAINPWVDLRQLVVEKFVYLCLISCIKSPTYLYIHGGGFVAGSYDMESKTCNGPRTPSLASSSLVGEVSNLNPIVVDLQRDLLVYLVY